MNKRIKKIKLEINKGVNISLSKNEIFISNKNTLANKNLFVDNEYIKKIGKYSELTNTALKQMFNVNNISPLLMKLKKWYNVKRILRRGGGKIYIFTLSNNKECEG